MPKMEESVNEISKATLAGKIETQMGDGTGVGRPERELGICVCPVLEAAALPRPPRSPTLAMLGARAGRRNPSAGIDGTLPYAWHQARIPVM